MPSRYATALEPRVQGAKIPECRYLVADPRTGIAHELLHLALLPASGVVVGIEQHLVSLSRIRPQHLRTAVAALELCDQQLLAFAADHGPVLAPVELKRLPRSKLQRYEWSATCTRRFLLMFAATREQRHRPGRSSRDTPTRSNHPTAGAGYADAYGLGSLHAQATRTAPQQTHPACSGCAASDRPVPGSRRPTTYESCSRRASFLWLSRESIPFRAHASV